MHSQLLLEHATLARATPGSYPALHVHCCSEILASTEFLFRLQSRQLAAEVAATVVEYFPCTQSRHVEEDAKEYLPGPHEMQTVAPNVDEYCPCAQFTQLVSEVACDVMEYLPCPQEIQLVSEMAANVVEYFPASQGTQPSGVPDNSL